MICLIVLQITGRPQTFPNVRTKITAEAAEFSDIRVGSLGGFSQGGAEGDDISDAMASGDQASGGIAFYFIPPEVGIDFCGYFDRQVWAGDLDVRITVAGEGDGTAEIGAVVKVEMERQILRGVQEGFGRISEQANSIAPEVTPMRILYSMTCHLFLDLTAVTWIGP